MCGIELAHVTADQMVAYYYVAKRHNSQRRDHLRLIQFEKEDNESKQVDKTLTLVSFPDKWAAGNSDSDDSAALDSDYEDSDFSDTDGSDDE